MKNKLKEELESLNDKLSGIFYSFHSELGSSKVLELMLALYNENLYDIDKDIEYEEKFISKIIGARNAKAELQRLKLLRKEHLKLIKMFEKFINLEKSLADLKSLR